METHTQYSPDSPKEDQDWVSAPNVVRTDKDLIVKDFFSVNNTEAFMGRGQKLSRTVVSSSVYSTAATDFLLAVNSLTTAPTIGLPRPSFVGKGKTFVVKDEVGGAATTTITIRSQGEETIDGASTATITTNYGSKRFYASDGAWFTY